MVFGGRIDNGQAVAAASASEVAVFDRCAELAAVQGIGGAADKMDDVGDPRFKRMAADSLPIGDSAGFFAEATGSDVRRQLRMSVGVVVVLAFGIVSAAFTVGSHPLDAKRAVVSTPLTSLHAETNPVGARPI